MGADLYIKSITDKANEKYKPLFEKAVAKRDKLRSEGKSIEAAQKVVEKYYEAMYPDDGYFRDSYNGSGFLSRFGLSWWRDVTPLQDDEGYLDADAIRKLQQMITDAKPETITKKYLKENYCTVDDGENSPATWTKYYAEKRELFLKFLQRALDKGEKVYASL